MKVLVVVVVGGAMGSSEVVEECGVLAGVLGHCLTVEEFGHAYILQETLSTPCFDHELTSQFCCFTRLERSKLDALIKRVTGHGGPVGEQLQHHGLSHRVRPQICLEPEALNARDLDLEH